MHGQHLIKAWSRTLSTLALSTGEAELGALAKGAAESEGIVSILHDFGMQASICISSDASAAIGITKRLGLGKVRHLSVADLWIQQKVRRVELHVEKVPGSQNPSDLRTKPLPRPRIDDLTTRMNIYTQLDLQSEI